MSWYQQQGGNVTLTLHIQPGAKKTEVAGLYGEALKIRLAAPPVDGKANQALLAFLAEQFKVPLRQVMLKSGDSSRRKIVIVTDTAVPPESLLGKP